MLTNGKSLPKILFLPLFLTLAAFVQGRQLNSNAKTSSTQPPPKTWIDPDTGHRIVRVSDEPNSASLYFNDNAYTSDGKEMVYSTPDGISVLDLKTFKTRRVVQGRARIIVAGYKTRNVYFLKSEGPATAGERSRAAGAERALYSANIDTGATRKVGVLPARGSIATINADETLAAGTYIEGRAGEDYGARRSQQTHPLDQPRNKGEMMERTLAAHLPRVLFTINIQTGERKILLHSTDWINHLLFSPTDPTLLMFCHEGPWHKVDRIWTINTDGSHKTLIHKRTMDMEIAGHEFWAPDGKTIWYDLQRPRGEDFWLAGYRVDSGERTWYHLQRNEWSIHFNVTEDGTLFCGDGGDPGQVAHATDGEWIYLFHPELIKNRGIENKDFIHPGVLHSERLVNMSKHNYRLEPNVRFTADKKWVIFRSNMFGPTYVFAVEVAKAGNPESAAAR
ncbi:MAG TPA: oligogalacturonate lyase family protein [Bryobacteraceae bacterium]